ncbi:hypothetical protein MalM25_03250 [Planctomycetes bacterium MalM25]|nr:hypothetical protein MalM25_03250 [Planctomycetes bacterium MalM25]
MAMPLRLLNSNAMTGPRRLGPLVLVLAVLPLVAGCPTEVPYQTGEEGAEAPAIPSDGPETPGDAVEVPPPGVEGEDSSPAESPEANDTQASAGGDRYATPPGQAPARMPWETDQPAEETPPEAERLFAGAETPAEPVAKAEEPVEEEAEEVASDDSFGDFLGDAYAGLIEEEPAKEPEPAEPEPTSVAATPTPDLGSRYEVNDLFPAEPDPADAPSAPPVTAEPATTIELEDPVEINDLWPADPPPADPTPEADPDAGPEPELPEEPTIVQEETEPFEPAETPPEPMPEPVVTEEPPPLFADAPEPEQAEPIETLPEPPATRSEEAEEPELAFDPEPALDTPSPREPPLAGSAIDPLPAVPVLPFNTRHLAWLLGAKYGLAELADLDGATPDEVAEWSSEVDRLARELRIGTPPSARQSTEPAERVGRMMRAAARTGEALASEHGVDHAALMEISLKTNALLVVAEKRPDLAGPVARAVRDAADRALLPRFLWDQAVRVLENDPTPEEALDAVNGLHERVESFLR